MKPYILEETDDFAVVFKPPRMHSEARAPLKQETDTLMHWYAEFFPRVTEQGGLVQRLDYETRGLLLIAKNRKSLEYFRALQKRGGIIKEYGALTIASENPLSGFPPPPPLTDAPFSIESFFRPFGPGRKQVRPVTDRMYRELAKDQGGYYRTEIISIKDNLFTVRIKRGFRHQIRCHLAWIGRPILNDPLYGKVPPDNGAFLALSANALFFSDPTSSGRREYRIGK